jgi:hypothetical protein
LLTENYKLTKNKTFVNALISGLYDISNNTIVDLHLSNTNSERKQYLGQFKYLNKNDIVIHDRGYYSAKLLYELYIKEVYPIFRMKINDSNVEDLLKSDENDKIYIINNENTNFIDIKLRLIKYIVNNKKYILGTTLLDTEFTIEKLAKLYHDRWKIETYFRTIKYDISFKNFHSKKENLIKQEIYMNMFITQLARIMEEIFIGANKDIKQKLKKYKTNFKNNIENTSSKILFYLLYKKNKNKTIICIITNIFEYLIKIRPNRTYARISITPFSKWYKFGNSKT